MTTLFAAMKFRDADKAIAFLTAVGFTEAACFRAEDGSVAHAEYSWRDSGGLMFGSTGGGSPELDEHAGHGSCYCVCGDPADVDRIYAAALAAGGRGVQAPYEPGYGGRSCDVTDPEGNAFSFGTYPGERG